MYFDDSLKLQGAGAGILFNAPGGEHLKYTLQLLFLASNNAAEYEAWIHGLNIAISLSIKKLMSSENWRTNLKGWSSTMWKETATQQQTRCRSWDPVGPKSHLGSSSKKFHTRVFSQIRQKNATP
jgi:ribonuclease HI